MRDTKASNWFVRNASGASMHAIRLAAVALGIGLVMATGAARAQEDDEEDDTTFEEKIIQGIMTGIGGTNMDNRGIDYRERSPLVVPPKIDLPPPAVTSKTVNVPNWPKDPDEARHKAAVASRKNDDKDPLKAARVLTPAEMAAGKTAKPAPTGMGDSDTLVPGGEPGRTAILSPSQLGFTGSMFKVFKGNSSETAPFKGEPTRETLTQPPVGYQTPSSNFQYGTGPKESLNKEYDPAAGKYGD